MSEKTGVLLRGVTTATLADDGLATMTITPKTVTHWRGKNAHTLASGGASRGAAK
jgi:hypothetical protein